MKSTEKVNTATLLRHAFDTLKKLNAKVISPDEAKAHSDLIKQSNNLLKYELDRAKAITRIEGLKLREIEELD
tara:strand:+ start:620 stop:838 length:219 start_codon:yes stop_codon:yes gene_type:complete